MDHTAPLRFLGIEELPPLSSNLPDRLAMRWREGLSPSHRWRFSRWQKEHPDARFADYYVARIEGKLARGKSHRTLGRSRWSERKLEGQERILTLLRHWGLEPHSHCVEYGCGSLRIGQHLIRFLEPGRYLGLDVSDRFFDAGLTLLGEEIVRCKTPALQVIQPDLLADLCRTPPDFLLSMAVLHHVHPRELDEFLAAILGLVGPDTQAFVSFREWHRTIQTAEKSWSHPAHGLAERILGIDPGVEVQARRLKKLGQPWDPSWKSLLRIARPPAAAG